MLGTNVIRGLGKNPAMVDFILVPLFGGGAAPEVGLDASTPGGYRPEPFPY